MDKSYSSMQNALPIPAKAWQAFEVIPKSLIEENIRKNLRTSSNYYMILIVFTNKKNDL